MSVFVFDGEINTDFRRFGVRIDSTRSYVYYYCPNGPILSTG